MALIPDPAPESIADIFAELWFCLSPEKRDATLNDLMGRIGDNPLASQVHTVLLLTDGLVQKPERNYAPAA